MGMCGSYAHDSTSNLRWYPAPATKFFRVISRLNAALRGGVRV